MGGKNEARYPEAGRARGSETTPFLIESHATQLDPWIKLLGGTQQIDRLAGPPNRRGEAASLTTKQTRARPFTIRASFFALGVRKRRRKCSEAMHPLIELCAATPKAAATTARARWESASVQQSSLEEAVRRSKQT